MNKKKEEEESSLKDQLSSILTDMPHLKFMKLLESTNQWINNISVVLSEDDLYKCSKCFNNRQFFLEFNIYLINKSRSIFFSIFSTSFSQE